VKEREKKKESEKEKKRGARRFETCSIGRQKCNNASSL
jgi:hypothetical protein